MEENQTPPTSNDPFVVEEPQEPTRRKTGTPAGPLAQEASPISVDELLKGDAAPETAPGDASAEAPAADVDVPRAASILESLLLVSSEPLPVEKARRLLGELSREQFEEVFLALREKYPSESSGILVEKVAKGVQFRTNPANQEHVRKLFDVKPPRFSRAALETVAIIAYKQPLTRQEIEQIRGVDCAGSLKTLMDRRLVRVVGKKDVPGKPFLFGTTREFMEVFGLGSLGDLPSMREIEEYLSTSAATPVEPGRPGLDLPFADGDAPVPDGSPREPLPEETREAGAPASAEASAAEEAIAETGEAAESAGEGPPPSEADAD